MGRQKVEIVEIVEIIKVLINKAIFGYQTAYNII